MLAVLPLAVGGSFFIDGPLRRVVVRPISRQLKGYSADIRKLSFHPIGLSLTLHNLRYPQRLIPIHLSSTRPGWTPASSARRSCGAG